MKKNGRADEVRRTNLMAEVEKEVGGVALTAYIHKQLSKGVSRAELARRHDIPTSTLSRWAKLMGYGQAAVIDAGWRSGLIPVARYG